MKWDKRFIDMTADELKAAYSHHRKAFGNANELACIAGATFPGTFVRNASIANNELERMRLIENVARKNGISLR